MKYKLSDLFELQMGKTPSRDNPEYWSQPEFPWISIADLSNADKYIYNTKESLSRQAVEESGIKIIPAQTVIMSFKLSIGKVSITPVPMYSNEAIMAFIDKGIVKIKPEYLYYLLLHRNWDEETNKAVMGKTLNKATLSEVVIDIHPIEEQERIVTILDKASEIIDSYQCQLRTLDTLIKARFVEMFGREEDGKFPIRRLGDYAKLQGGYAFKSSDFVDVGVPLVQIGNVNKDYLEWDMINHVPEEFLTKYKDFSLNKGDLVMAMTRPIIKSLDSVKIAKVEETDLPCLLNQRVGRFCLKEELHPAYLEVMCKTDSFKDYVERMSGNSLQPNISSKQVEDYCIILPPMGLQMEFALFVSRVDKSKVAIQAALEKAQLLFDSLMQQYFN